MLCKEGIEALKDAIRKTKSITFNTEEEVKKFINDSIACISNLTDHAEALLIAVEALKKSHIDLSHGFKTCPACVALTKINSLVGETTAEGER